MNAFWVFILPVLASFNYVVVSSPSRGLISYCRVNKATGQSGPFEDLITTGLSTPLGMTIDRNADILYVADPGAKAIFAFQLAQQGGSLMTTGQQYTVVPQIEARWVSVDQNGTLFFTDESEGAEKIAYVRYHPAFAQPSDLASLASGPKGVVVPVYRASGGLPMVKKPAGLAVDGMNVYWVNKEGGTDPTVGSVVKAPEHPPLTRTLDAVVRVLASNAENVYGLCASRENLYYTADPAAPAAPGIPASVSGQILGSKKFAKGDRGVISTELTKPRGCAWDGDGAIYIADRGANKIYSVPANMPTFLAVDVQEIADVDDPFGVVAVPALGDSGAAGASFVAAVAALFFVFAM
mmetsp:Transcript_56100/g.122910  ORF Transcript_56100/g.122910 Transcript_56100/m.122910 type:complete len:352 (+) Transcript_56100:142-1197(+)